MSRTLRDAHHWQRLAVGEAVPEPGRERVRPAQLVRELAVSVRALEAEGPAAALVAVRPQQAEAGEAQLEQEATRQPER